MTRRTAFVLTTLFGLSAAEAPRQNQPVLTSWVVNPAPNAALRGVMPEVHSVEATERDVIIRSAGLSLHSFGALEANTYLPPAGIRSFTFHIPRNPVPASVRPPLPLGIAGAFVTGVPIFNPASTASYRNQNLWHRDAVATAAHPSSPLLEALLSTAGRHSPLIGFALDGFPIYGPFGCDAAGVRPMRSSYQLRPLTARTQWPDGTTLTPAQAGPPVTTEFPLGTFIEDYAYVPGSGDLDESNGRWAVTPEYPDGTYAYFLSTSAAGQPAYPYLLGPVYRGQLLPSAESGPSYLHFDIRNRAGRPMPFLEKVHEQPLHLLIVSEDLSNFAHIHPEPVLGGGFAISHTFPKSGTYHLYADYSIPGEGPVVKHTVRTVDVPTQPARPEPRPSLTAAIQFGAPLTANTDIPLQVELRDAQTGQPVTDLDPFLGAWAHFVLISADHHDFIHAHPEGEAPSDESAPHTHTAVTGPSPSSIRTTVGFRRPGRYRLWAQFQRHGQPITIPFDLSIAAAKPATATSAVPQGAIRIAVTAAGYEPAQVHVNPNQRVRLAFDRKDAQNCGGTVRFPALGITRPPPGTVTLVEFDAPRQATLTFTCGMGMLRGAVVVRADPPPPANPM